MFSGGHFAAAVPSPSHHAHFSSACAERGQAGRAASTRVPALVRSSMYDAWRIRASRITRHVSQAARLLERSERETSLDKYSKSKEIHEFAAHTSESQPSVPVAEGERKRAGVKRGVEDTGRRQVHWDNPGSECSRGGLVRRA